MRTLPRQRQWAWTLFAAGLLIATSRANANAQVRLTYLGTAGWEISDGKTVVLVDPFLSRLRRVIPNDDTLPGDTRPFFTSDDIAHSDTAVVDRHIRRATSF